MQSLIAPSKTLTDLLDNLAPDFEKLQSKIDRIFQVGRQEGLKDMDIGNLVRERMEQHYSQATIRNVLPESAKHTEKIREFALKTSAKTPKSNRFEYVGMLSRTSRDRRQIVFPTTLTSKLERYMGKKLKVTIEEA